MVITIIMIIFNLAALVLGVIAHCRDYDSYNEFGPKVKYKKTVIGKCTLNRLVLGKEALSAVDAERVEQFYATAETTLKLLEVFSEQFSDEDVQANQLKVMGRVDAFNANLEFYQKWSYSHKNGDIGTYAFHKINEVIMAAQGNEINEIMKNLETSISEGVLSEALLNSAKGECLDRYLDAMSGLKEEENGQETDRRA